MNKKGLRFPHDWERFANKMPNYIKVPSRLKEKLYGKKAFYVNVMFKCPDDGNEKKHIMGPYSRNQAESIMTDLLSKGDCCWVEEDYIR